MAEPIVNSVVSVDPMWGRLSVDKEALLDKLGAATNVVYEAAKLAQYRTDAGYPINSPLGDLLGGLSQVIDAVIDQLQAEDTDSSWA